MEKKKNYCLVISLLLFTTMSFAQSIQIGYHGFVEGGCSFDTGGTGTMNWVEINTIHGYQFTPNLFAGAGIGCHFMPEVEDGNVQGFPYTKRDATKEIPVFADFRWTILDKNITPFVDLRLGKSMSKDGGLYGTVGAGCRYAFNNKYAIYAAVAYSYHKLTFEKLKMVTTTSNFYFAYDDFKEEKKAISIKVGFEF